MFSVNKQFFFEAAHRLMLHKGKCKNLHGHNYKVDVTLYSRTLNKNQMVRDFSDFPKTIVEMWDHTLILNQEDPLVEILKNQNIIVIPFPGEPTAENMALELATRIKKICSLDCITVQVWENDKCSAVYSDIQNVK